MNVRNLVTLCGALALGSVPLADAGAAPAAHHPHRSAPHHVQTEGAATPATPTPGYATSSADIIAQAAARRQNEPGVTRAIDAGAISSATGGPAGGLPGNAGGP